MNMAEIDVQHGTVDSYPLTAGVAYTWWALPWGKAEEWYSKLLDFGLVFRIEVGPDFATYDLEKQPFLAAGTKVGAGEAERVKDSKVELYWNFQLGLVI